MSQADKIRELLNKSKFKKDVWPHQFTKDGATTHIGTDRFNIPMFATPMICVHCYKKYVSGVQPKPQEPCPARKDARELKRLKRFSL